MGKQTVRDVIGEPEAWPNHFNGHTEGPPDMRGAVILDVIPAGHQIGIHTQGAACGNTFSVFEVRDPDLRERTLRALTLKRGANVHEAVAVEI